MNVNNDLIKFSKFLDYYKDDYGKPSWEISMPNPEDEDEICDDLVPLVKSDYIMLDFDLMCKDANFYPKRTKEECNRPSTVDALYYRFLSENKLELTLVEFKSFDFDWNKDADYNASLKKVLDNFDGIKLDSSTQKGIERLNSIKKTYGNTIEFSLRLKPYESLFVVLPKIYDEYCMIKSISKEDQLNFFNFFQSDLCMIKLVVVGQKNEDLNKAYMGKLGSLLEKQFRRLDYVNVLTPHDHRECFPDEFDLITLMFDMCDKSEDTIKSLNKI